MQPVPRSSECAVADHQNLDDAHHVSLLRLHEAATLATPTAVARVAACRRELQRAIPDLTGHVVAEEAALRSLGGSATSVLAEGRIATNISQLRELRTILETANLMIEHDGSSEGRVLEGFCVYVAAFVDGWMAVRGLFLPGHPCGSGRMNPAATATIGGERGSPARADVVPVPGDVELP